jgi:hypothetical protein
LTGDQPVEHRGRHPQTLSVRARGFGAPIVAFTSLVLGIGANTAIFSLLDAVMLRSLPVKDPQQLVCSAKGGCVGSATTSPSQNFRRRKIEPSLDGDAGNHLVIVAL